MGKVSLHLQTDELGKRVICFQRTMVEQSQGGILIPDEKKEGRNKGPLIQDESKSRQGENGFI